MATGDRSTESGDGGSGAVSAGRVGRAHGLDGSFYVTGARPRLLAPGAQVVVAGRAAVVVRRAGTDEHPIVRVEGIDDRATAERMRGVEITVELALAPALEDGEWWASELEGCEVVDGERHIGMVARLLELPSCEALVVRLAAPESPAAGERPDGRPAGQPGESSARAPAGSSGARPAGPPGELLVPMVRDAIRRVDVARRRIDVDMSFLEQA